MPRRHLVARLTGALAALAGAAVPLVAQGAGTVEVPSTSVWVATTRRLADEGATRGPGALAWRSRRYIVVPAPATDVLRWRTALRDRRLVTESPTDGEVALAALTEGVRTGPDSGAVVVFVHGFATSLAEASRQGLELAWRSEWRGPLVVFAWPSRRLGVGWPRAGHLFTAGYWSDVAIAEANAGALAGLLDSLVRRVGGDRVVLVAHSLGNQLVARALETPALRARLAAAPLRAVVYASPDLDAHALADTIVPSVRALARRQVLYGARNDRVLPFARLLHGAPRAGQLPGGVHWPAALEVVDITGAPAATLHPSVLDSHHDFHRAGAALAHLFGRVVRGACGDAPCGPPALSAP